VVYYQRSVEVEDRVLVSLSFAYVESCCECAERSALSMWQPNTLLQPPRKSPLFSYMADEMAQTSQGDGMGLKKDRLRVLQSEESVTSG
jgi:hypothetical protein